MAYIKQEKIENAKAEIVDRMQVFINEYKQYSESTVDYHYGRVDGLEVAKRLVKSILTDLTEQATADVEKVVHGEWQRQKQGFYFLCSVCGKAAATKGNYCHACGAKMDKESTQ